MPQRMGRDVFLNSRSFDVAAQNLPRAHASQWLAAGVQEQNPFAAALLQSRPKLLHICRDRRYRRAAHRYQTLLASLSEDANQLIVEQHIALAERDPLRDPEARPIGQLEHRAIAKHERVVESRSGDEAGDLLDRQ